MGKNNEVTGGMNKNSESLFLVFGCLFPEFMTDRIDIHLYKAFMWRGLTCHSCVAFFCSIYSFDMDFDI